MDLELASAQIKRNTQRIGLAVIVSLYGTGILLAVVTAFRHLPGEGYYQDWGREYSFFTYGSSLQYFAAAEAAFICFWITRYHRRSSTGGAYHPWLWITAAAAFVYASLDEMFFLHERMLGSVDRSQPWLSRFYFGAADDLFVISCGIGALIFTLFFFKDLRPVRQARSFYLAGLILLTLAGLVDYLPREILQQRLPLGVEELAEYFAGTSFSVAFLLYAVDRSRLMLLNWLASLRLVEMPAVGPVTGDALGKLSVTEI